MLASSPYMSFRFYARHFVVQSSRFAGRAVRGDFGLSCQQQRPVGQIIFGKVQATLELTSMAAALALIVGVPMGICTGPPSRHRALPTAAGTVTDRRLAADLSDWHFACPGVALVLSRLPSFGRGNVIHFNW